MPLYDPAEIVLNIEREIAAAPTSANGNGSHPAAHPGPPVVQDPLRRSVTERLQFSIVPSMRAYHRVGAVPSGTRFSVVKKAIARMMRLVSGPQSCYNSNATAAVEVLAEHLEHARLRLLESEERQRRLEERLERAAPAGRDLQEVRADLLLLQQQVARCLERLDEISEHQRRQDGRNG